MSDGNIRILGGSAGMSLAKDVCRILKIDMSNMSVGRHNDGEVNVKVNESVRGDDVYIINPTPAPLENAMEMVLLGRSVRPSAKTVTLVIPYLGYNRGDQKDGPRTAISAKVMAEFLMLSKADRVVLFDIHSEPTMEFFDCNRVERLYMSYMLIPYLRNIVDTDTVLASPDSGGMKRTRGYGSRLHINNYAAFIKNRPSPGQVSDDMIMMGDVKDRKVVFIDDIIDTGGTLIKASKIAKKAGAEEIYVCAAHGVFSGNAIEELKKAPIDKIIVTDSIPRPAGFFSEDGNVVVVPIAELIAETIRRIHRDLGLSSLFIEEDHLNEEKLMEMVQQCPFYVPAERAGDASFCSAHSNGGTHLCWVKNLKDLDRCADHRNSV